MLENISEETPETYMHIFREIFREIRSFLSGHMDTVEPSKGKKGIIGEDGVIRSAGKQFLELMMWQDLWRSWKESAV